MGIFNRKELTLSLLVKMLSLLEDPLELWCIYAPVLSYAVAFYLLESFVASANNFVTSFGLFLVVLVFSNFFLITLQPFLPPSALLQLTTVNHFLMPQLKEVSSEI